MQSFDMEYQHPHFVYQQEMRHPMDHSSRPMLHHHHSHSHMMDNYMHVPQHLDYADFPSHGSYQDEFDDNPEILSRPRLTKEQVDVLESQFQAHPKPNSNVKRALALQTKLTLPRVANWFQNRRAKAKQQKKQEEFEILQAMGATGEWDGESGQAPHPYPKSKENKKDESDEGTPSASEQTGPAPQTASAPSMTRTTSTQEASYASLQRALAAAQAARGHGFDDSFIDTSTLESPPNVPDFTSSNESSQFPSSTFSEWTNASSLDWVSSSHSDEQFDFSGLNIHPLSSEQYSNPDPNLAFRPSPEEVASDSDEWVGSLQTPTLSTHPSQDTIDLMSQSLPLPQYPQPRRGSSSDDLTAGISSIGLNRITESPTSSLHPITSSFPKPDASIDLAARRKRPRPAMLGTAALRSRSYGAPPTMSPTIRHGNSPIHPLRHVKSTGNSLNVHFSGIRKPTSAQRSPLNISTFAEAEALNAMIAGTPSLECPPSAHSHHAPHQSLSPEDGTNFTQTIAESEIEGLHHPQHQISEYFNFGPNMQVNLASPPATPLKSEYFAHLQQVSLAPPMSAPPQYAVFPEYTPPYSAGPLTASSWSDAPLTSPEHSSFAHAIAMPNANYISPMTHDFSSVTNFSHPFTSPPELKSDHKTTEFFIQEFPQQKENHAHAAQQLQQYAPKNYVFANATANDFSD